jgi:hypothetical protein
MICTFYQFLDIFSEVWPMEKKLKQAGAELCQAQIKLGLAKIEIFFHLNEN